MEGHLSSNFSTNGIRSKVSFCTCDKPHRNLRKARHANQGEGPINQLLFLQEHILLHEEGLFCIKKEERILNIFLAEKDNLLP